MLEVLLKGFTLGLLLSISVGPVMFSILKQSLNNGHTGGMAFIIGVSASDITMVLISNVFTELFSAISTHRKPIGIAGSIFLISLGVYFLFFKKIFRPSAGMGRGLQRVSLSLLKPLLGHSSDIGNDTDVPLVGQNLKNPYS